MSATLQVLYPSKDDTKFDYEYYMGTHMGIVGSCIGEHIQSTLITKGLAGGPDIPPGYHAIAPIELADQASLDAEMGKLGPAVEDIANFTNSRPQFLIGQHLGD